MSPFKRIVKRAGIKRVSKEALEEIREVVEESAGAIAERAAQLAGHAGRKTVMREDIELAAKRSGV